MKISLIILSILVALPTFACINAEFKALNCIDSSEAEPYTFQIKNFKLTSTSLSMDVPGGQKIKHEFPLTNTESNPTWVTKVYCEGAKLVIEHNVLGVSTKEYFTINETGFKVSGNTPVLYEVGGGKFEVEVAESKSDCTVTN